MKWLRIFKKYYTIQALIDLGWGEMSWFTSSLVEAMAVLYLLEKVGIVVTGIWIYLGIPTLFVIFLILGWFLKKSKIYDQSKYVDAEIDPVMKEIFKMAKKYNEEHK